MGKVKRFATHNNIYSARGTSSNSFLIHNLNFSSASCSTKVSDTNPTRTYPLNSFPNTVPGTSSIPASSTSRLQSTVESTGLPSRWNFTNAVVPARGLTQSHVSSCLMMNLSSIARLVVASCIFFAIKWWTVSGLRAKAATLESSWLTEIVV